MREAFITLKKNKRQLNIRKDNKGTTLAEMIVTFALIGLFLACAVAVISSSVLMHGEITGAMRAQTVGDMLLTKITGELAAAQLGPADEYGLIWETSEGAPAMIIGSSEDTGADVGNGVAFYSRDGLKTRIYIKDGLLILHYDALHRINPDGTVISEPEREWGFDSRTYMGYRITDFEVFRANDGNVIEVKITLLNLKTGYEYSARKTVGCYNFETEKDFEKIREGNIISL